MASLPAFDGWADQYFCYDETKDYVLPNNRAATQYYHDHAVGITSENAYNGMPPLLAPLLLAQPELCFLYDASAKLQQHTCNTEQGSDAVLS